MRQQEKSKSIKIHADLRSRVSLVLAETSDRRNALLNRALREYLDRHHPETAA